MANLLRNDLQESLEDLGPDSTHGWGQPVGPGVESTISPNCTPLEGWTFTLGDGFGTRIDGLTTVGEPAAVLNPTQASVPELDQDANPTGAHHAFCYYYAVDKPPLAGEIVVRKQLADGATDSRAFNFTGNVTYDPDQKFNVDTWSGSGERRFRRGAATTDPWTFAEEPAAGWELADLICASANGGSTSTVNGAEASVELADGDTVTCTYTNRRIADEPLTVLTSTTGGVGGPFDYTVTDTTGTDPVGTATTTDPNTPVEAGTASGLSGNGTWTITQTMPPPTASGHWTVEMVQCNGTTVEAETTDTTATITIPAGTTVQQCLFTNKYHPDGSITVTKTTEGGAGTFSYTLTAENTDAAAPDMAATEPAVASVTTEKAGEPASTTVEGLATGRYTIVELETDDPDGDHWDLTGATCDSGGDLEYGDGITLELTEDDPHVECTFQNKLTHKGDPIVDPPLPVTGAAWPYLLGGTAAAALAAGFLLVRARRARTRW